MARKRMIDPSIWTDEGMAELTPRQQLLYIGLFSNADDDGRLNGSAAAIRLMLPGVYGGAPKIEVDADLAAVLREMRQVVAYESDGRRYLVIRKFRAWQKVDHPTKSMLPAPPECSEDCAEPSVSVQGGLTEGSANTRASLISLSRLGELEELSPPGGREVSAATAAPPRRAVPKKPPGANLGPLVDAFDALHLARPSLEGAEAPAAQRLLAHHSPEEIAACWQDFAMTEYGDAYSKRELSFVFLASKQHVANWARWKAAPPTPNGRAKTGLRGPGGRQEFTTAQLIVDARQNNIAVDTDEELASRPTLLAEVKHLEAIGWHS